MPHKPDMPCAKCGKLIWRSRTSLPEGGATCRPCRAADQPGGRHGFASTYRRGCRCDACREAQRIRGRAYALRVKAETGDWPKLKYVPRAPKVPCSGGCGRNVTTARGENPKCRRCRRGLALPKAIRMGIYDRDGWTCGICLEPVSRTAPPNDPWAPTLDHVLPRALGGSDELDNLRLAHRWCNTVRGKNEWLTIDDVA